MLNQVHVEGYVTKKIWQYDGFTFFRLAAYRDQDRPRKKAKRQASNERDQPDYVTVRVSPSLTAMPIAFEPGQRVQVHGWLESQSQKSSLADFLEAAEGPKIEIDAAKAQKSVAYRDFTRIVAERIVILPKSKHN
ncbi:MAG: hypothetical protein U9R05_06690 [Chloroflexota bacterium]|nr:hypothetical protein [Chloroflexota bacterium]